MTQPPAPRLTATVRWTAMHADGSPVAPHYGSAFGELTACTRQVGIVMRADLSCMRFRGPAAAIDAVLWRLTDEIIAPGGSVHVAEAWWCRPSPDTILILCSSHSLPRLSRLLNDESKRHRGILVEEDASDHAFVGIVGLRTPEVLDSLGVYGPQGNPRCVPPCRAAEIAGIETTWLIESDTCAVACVPAAHLSSVTRTIADRARPFGLTRVGQEAFANYMVLQRSEQRRVAVP